MILKADVKEVNTVKEKKEDTHKEVFKGVHPNLPDR